MAVFHWEMPSGFTPAICLRRNFLYILILKHQGYKSIGQNIQNIVVDSHANFGEKLPLALTAQHQKPKLSWILEQIFQDGGRRTCPRTGREVHQIICQFLIVEACSIFLNQICWLFDVESMLIIGRYFKKYVELTQAEDQVTWPDLLHRHKSKLASFREWLFVSVWLRIRAQVPNPC